jgi:uncharacterized protein (DUF2147 family)
MTNLVRMILRAIVAATFLVAPGSGRASPVDASGTWLTEDGRARIRLERCGATLEQICGYIVWMQNPTDAKGQSFRDEFNPDPAKRSRPLLGHQLILGLQPTPEGRFEGQIYNAENGKSYSVSVWRDSSERLKVRGCMLSVFCATQAWTQTTNALPQQLLGMTGDTNGPRPDKEWAPQPKLKTSSTAKAVASSTAKAAR